MVNYLVALFFIPLSLFGATLTVSVSDTPLSPFDDVAITVEVFHDLEEKVNVDSFRLGGEELQVDSIGDKTEGLKIVSRYTFSRPLQSEELFVLPSLSVEVGNKVLTHLPITIQPKIVTPTEGLFLRGYVYGEKPFYPGETLRFSYRIYYRGSIDLIKEELPLLQPQGFSKLGELQVEEGEEKGFHYQELSQNALVINAGEFSFPPSMIIGKLPNGRELQSTTAPFILEINSFPLKGRPLSFGEVEGKLFLNLENLKKEVFSVGDSISLKLTVKGDRDIRSLVLPDIFCQPGFSGFFSGEGFSKSVQVSDTEKEFYFDLRILSSFIKEIPSIEVSSFDGETRTYKRNKTAPLAIDVAPLISSVLESPLMKKVDWKTLIEIQRKQLDREIKVPEVKTYHFATIFIFLLVLQEFLRRLCRYLYFYLTRSPIFVLWRLRWLKKEKLLSSLYNLFANQPSKEAKQFIQKIERIRYGGEPFSKREVLQWAESAFRYWQ